MHRDGKRQLIPRLDVHQTKRKPDSFTTGLR
uniref:Uncharacterized protein n=1 Tax=Amphimedon queenslandica TaxID=400682 RepID=A0A1X7VEY9_AMPQE